SWWNQTRWGKVTPRRRAALRLEALEDRTVPTVAYLVPAGTVGQQAFSSPLGMDFDFNTPIPGTRPGCLDSGPAGRSLPLAGRLYTRDTQQQVGAALSFPAGTPGTLIDGSRFLDLPTPLLLPAGFHGTVVGEGYGAGEGNGDGGLQPLSWTTDSGG